MKLSLGLLAACTFLAAGCFEVHEAGFDTSNGFQPIAVGGVEDGRFEVCVDGADQPHGTIAVFNLTLASIDMGFVTTGSLKTTAIDSTLRPSSIVEIRTEMLGPFPKDASNDVGTISILNIGNNSRMAGPYTGVLAVDARVIEALPLEWDERGTPSVVLLNPSPFATKVHLASVGRWFSPQKEIELPPKKEIKVPLSMAGPAILPRRVAAILTIEGTRCSKADLGQLRTIEIPSAPFPMADPPRSTTHVTAP